jgi:hypothetical protein
VICASLGKGSGFLTSATSMRKGRKPSKSRSALVLGVLTCTWRLRLGTSFGDA